MEEQQIQEFVHRVFQDRGTQLALSRNPAVVIANQGFSPRVAAILMRLAPLFTLERPLDSGEKWWHA